MAIIPSVVRLGDMETLHFPPTYTEIKPNEPVVFLAGPIQGAPDWQRTATGLILHNPQAPPQLHIANPRREFKDPLFDKNEQLKWEQRHLGRAATRGVAVFWLAKESPDAPVPNKPGRAYGQTTRIEFGMVIGWRQAWQQALGRSVHIVLGMEPGYSGSEDYYRFTAGENDIVIHDNLEEICEEAVAKLGQALATPLSGEFSLPR